MPSTGDYYSVLEVSAQATAKEIKAELAARVWSKAKAGLSRLTG